MNAFVANVSDTRPPGWVDFDLNGDDSLMGLYDFYSLVAHEIGHAVGFSNYVFLDFEEDFSVDTNIRDQNGAGTDWVWNSPSLGSGFGEGGALLTDTNGSSESDGFFDSGPVHTAFPFLDANGNPAVP